VNEALAVPLQQVVAQEARLDGPLMDQGVMPRERRSHEHLLVAPVADLIEKLIMPAQRIDVKGRCLAVGSTPEERLMVVEGVFEFNRRSVWDVRVWDRRRDEPLDRDWDWKTVSA
jgi:hypothetical protein